MPPGARAPRRIAKTEVIDPEPSTVEDPLPSFGQVVGHGVMRIKPEPEAVDMRRLYVVRRAFNQHSIGDSVYLEHGDAVPLVAIALVEEVAHGPNPAGA
jgi:hypothetical protein